MKFFCLNKYTHSVIYLQIAFITSCIIKKRFFDGKTQMEVAQEIHISQAQVSRLEKGALQSMRKYV